MIKLYKYINVSIIGTRSASIPQNQREAPLPAGLSRWHSGIIAVGHVTEGSWVRFPLETSFFLKKFVRYYKPSFAFIYLLAYNVYPSVDLVYFFEVKLVHHISLTDHLSIYIIYVYIYIYVQYIYDIYIYIYIYILHIHGYEYVIPGKVWPVYI